MTDTLKLAARLRELSDFLDECGIGRGDHSDKPTYYEAADAIEKLQAFKTWVHAYLDGKGVPHHPPGTHGAEGCRIGDRMDYVFAEVERLRKSFAEEAAAHDETIRHRDFCEGWADKLAAGVGDIEVIGEHSNLNNPWETAYGLMRSLAEFNAVEADRDRLAGRVKALEKMGGHLRHLDSCASGQGDYLEGTMPTCDCGLNDLLVAALSTTK